MTDTPPTPRKHRAPGAGRKAKPDKRHLLPIRCSDEVYQRILDNTTPEERAQLLDADAIALSIAFGNNHHNCKCVDIPDIDTNPGNTIP